MKKALSLIFAIAVMSLPAFAGDKAHKSKDKDSDELNNPPNNNANVRPGGSGNVLDHGGPVMTNAKVVYVFWGWASNTTDNYVSELVSFRANGMINHIGMLSQYRSTGSTGLVGTQPDYFDAVPPSSSAVTDAMVQAEANKACSALAGGCRTDTIYEVFIPAGYYSSDSGQTSCGGPNLQYCAYHSNGNGVNLASNIKYSIQPYPSCSGCHGKASWTNFNDQEHFVVHETREAMSDPLGTAFWDRAGFEADDKCAWGGATLAFLFDETVGGHTYAYQMEYSNQTRSCVK